MFLHASQAKKAFLPLPTLEAVQHQLPWHLAFSQKLGRHAIASQNIAAGHCVLAEAAVYAVAEEACTQHTCHSCLAQLPEGPPELQQVQGVVVDAASRQYKRYCCQKCCEADIFRNFTGPVHAAIPQIAAQSQCDATLLHLILELDAQRSQPKKQGSTPDDNQQQQDSATNRSAMAKDDMPDIVTCNFADVEALMSPWDRNQKAWRDALTAGGLQAVAHFDLGCRFAVLQGKLGQAHCSL